MASFGTKLLLTASILTLTACDAADDDFAADESAVRVTPTGTDTRPGTIVVRAPTVAPGQSLIPSTVRVQPPSGPQITGALDQVFGPYRNGRASTSLEPATGGHGGSRFRLDSTITQDKDITVRLGGLGVRRSGAPAIVGLERGEFKSSAFAVLRSSLPLWTSPPDGTSPSVAFGSNDDGSRIAPVLPGTYTFGYGALDGVVVKVDSGEVKVLDAWDYTQRSVARIVLGDAELPDACTDDAILSYIRGPEVRFKLKETIEVGQNPALVSAARVSSPLPTFSVPCTTQNVVFKFAKKGAPAIDFPLARIDVDHVELTLPDGTSTTRSGKYKVLDTRGRAISTKSFPTKTGLYVLPGRYRISVEYTTASGTTASYEEEVDAL